MSPKAAESKTATQRLSKPSIKKHSVQFSAEGQDPLFTSLYLMRDSAQKLLGIPDLDKVQAIEVSVKVVE